MNPQDLHGLIDFAQWALAGIAFAGFCLGLDALARRHK